MIFIIITIKDFQVKLSIRVTKACKINYHDSSFMIFFSLILIIILMIFIMIIIIKDFKPKLKEKVQEYLR